MGRCCCYLDLTLPDLCAAQSQIKGRKLSEIINEEHENVKYLPGVKLPENVVATPSAVEAAEGADLLIFVLPHQVSGAHDGLQYCLLHLADTASSPAPRRSSSRQPAKSFAATSQRMREPSR